MVRRTGAHFFVLELSWSAAEPAPRRYRVEEITRAARRSPPVGRGPPSRPAARHTRRGATCRRIWRNVAFDDPKLSLRLGGLLDALRPALLDFQTLSLGDDADAYFADKPEELRAYRRLFDGAVQFLKKKAPKLLVGVTTAAPMDSPAPEVAAALHQRSPLLLYTYAPFVRGSPFEQRDPALLDKDWRAMLGGAGGRPIAFPLVSYSSSSENGSSPARQAEFVRRLSGLSGEGRRPGASLRPLRRAARRGRTKSPAFRRTPPPRSGAAARFSRTGAFRSSTASPSRRGASGSAIRGL